MIPCYPFGDSCITYEGQRNMARIITKAHDLHFKQIMKNKKFAQVIIRQHLSAEQLALINLSTLELQNSSFVSGDMREKYSDILYKVKAKNGGDCFIYLLIEHQSTPDKLMAFRFLEYTVRGMREHLDQGNKKLPLILPLLFYHGKQRPYPYGTDIFECFEDPALAKKYFLKPFNLVDVTAIPDEELKKNTLTALFQLVMKHVLTRDLLPYIVDLAQRNILTTMVEKGFGNHIINVVYYIMAAGHVSDREAFENCLIEHTGDLRKDIMTILEQYQQEKEQKYQQGMEQGMEQGLRKEKRSMAKRMLQEGLSIAFISRVTNLSIEAIEALQQETVIN